MVYAINNQLNLVLLILNNLKIKLGTQILNVYAKRHKNKGHSYAYNIFSYNISLY